MAVGWATLIGSLNLDHCSYYFNVVCNVLILDGATGAGMAKTFAEDLKEALEANLAAWASRSRWKNSGDAVAGTLVLGGIALVVRGRKAPTTDAAP